jgi:DNA-binding NarL/FixJ family response regulator
MAISLVFADDHPIVLNALAQLFAKEPGFTVRACCVNSEETLQAVRTYQPHILVLDLHIPSKGGLAVLQEMRKENLPTRVVLLTAGLSEDEVLEAIRLGVRGIVFEEMASQSLAQCLRKVYAGGECLEKHAVTRALEKMLHREAGVREATQILTPRELEIARTMASGLSNKEIARKLCVTEGTVKTHLHHIYKKLQVKGRMELIIYARDKALL